MKTVTVRNSATIHEDQVRVAVDDKTVVIFFEHHRFAFYTRGRDAIEHLDEAATNYRRHAQSAIECGNARTWEPGEKGADFVERAAKYVHKAELIEAAARKLRTQQENNVTTDKPRMGRPPLPPEQRKGNTPTRTVRLSDDDYAKFLALGGREWLERQIKRAKVAA